MGAGTACGVGVGWWSTGSDAVGCAVSAFIARLGGRTGSCDIKGVGAIMLTFDAARERVPLGGTVGRGRGPKRRSVPPATLALDVPEAEEILAVLWLL
jgi:hypothetical protein